MSRTNRFCLTARAMKAGLALALVLGLSGAFEPAYADPPPWAPAHGWRAKHKHKNKGKHKQHIRAERGGSYYAFAPSLGIDQGSCSREVIGTLLGAAGGGYAGSKVGKGDGQLAAVGAGVFLGAVIGGAIGRSMDELDQNCVGHALESASDGQTIAWNSPTGSSYQLTPTNTYQTASGGYCREYQTTAVIDGRSERLYGTTCRQPDGSWQLTN